MTIYKIIRRLTIRAVKMNKAACEPNQARLNLDYEYKNMLDY
jgi:hypothetical protein